MQLGDFIQKANLSNVMIIGTLIVGGVTAYNKIESNESDNKLLKEYVTQVETKVGKLELDTIEHGYKITSLETNNAKFDTTLATLNTTLGELNTTITEVKATLEMMKDK